MTLVINLLPGVGTGWYVSEGDEIEWP